MGKGGSGVMFSAFLPAVSKDALKRMSEEVRAWRIHQRSAPAQDIQESPQVVGRVDRKAATPVRALDMDDRFQVQPIDERGGVTGDCHAPFCGSPGVRFPRAIRRWYRMMSHQQKNGGLSRRRDTGTHTNNAADCGDKP